MNKTEIEYSMGPQHAGTGHMRLKVKLSGDHVIRATPDPGYVHRGAEKICETHGYTKSIPMLERTCLPDTSPSAWGYVMAVEKLMGIEPPPQAKFIRGIFAETNRIISHLYWLAIYGIFLGHSTMFMWPFAEREPFIDLLESISGSRLTYSDITPGGVRNPLPAKFEQRMKDAIANFKDRLVDYERIFFDTSIFQQRTKEIGVLTKEDAIRYGVTGPVLRASGVNYDLRKVVPYGPYEELDFEPIVFDAGDSYARSIVRLEEMRLSCELIEQMLDRLPPGDIMTKPPRRVPEGERYTRIESARGELGHLVVSKGKRDPYRVKINTPCFRHLPGLVFLLQDCHLADIPSIYWSFDYWPPNADR